MTVISKEKKGDSSAVSTPTVGEQPVALKIAYIGGGGRGWAPGLMKDLLLCPAMQGEIRLYDLDLSMAKFNAEYGNWLQGHPDNLSKWRYRAVDSLKSCLKNADFVFCSIEPGPIQYRKSDLEDPMKYGIYQPVGDSVGPGGCLRALRAIQDYRVIGEAIGAYAPNAWVLNFSNPMSVCTRTLYEVFPGIKAYGCCHEVFGTQGFLGRMYKRVMGCEKAPSREEMQVNVLGINHFTWIDKAQCRGVDMLALLREHLHDKGMIKVYTEKDAPRSLFGDSNQVKLDLFRRFGILAAAGDRHLAEFVPWYLTSEDSYVRWGFRMTPYSYRLERQREAPKQLKKEFKSRVFPKVHGSGEEYINQMLALLGKYPFRTNVNLPNRGQQQGLPAGAVVETNALFSENSLEPIASGALPDNVNILVQRHVANQETLVRAGLDKNRELGFQAFLNDPLVNISTDAAWKLYTTMLRKTGNPV